MFESINSMCDITLMAYTQQISNLPTETMGDYEKKWYKDNIKKLSEYCNSLLEERKQEINLTRFTDEELSSMIQYIETQYVNILEIPRRWYGKFADEFLKCLQEEKQSRTHQFWEVLTKDGETYNTWIVLANSKKSAIQKMENKNKGEIITCQPKTDEIIWLTSR